VVELPLTILDPLDYIKNWSSTMIEPQLATLESKDTEINLSYFVIESQLKASTNVSEESENCVLGVLSSGKRGKKCRKTFIDTIRSKQIKDAVENYNEYHPEVHRTAVSKHAKNYRR